MRTTIRIDDDLYRQVKTRAAQTGRTVAATIEDAVRDAIVRRPSPPANLSPLPTYGGGGVMPGVDLSSNAALRQFLDDGLPIDARR